MLEQDLRALKSAGAMLGITERTQVILSGKEIFRQGFYDILRAEGSFRNLLAREPDANMPLAARGALAIYSRWKGLENIEEQKTRGVPEWDAPCLCKRYTTSPKTEKPAAAGLPAAAGFSVIGLAVWI